MHRHTHIQMINLIVMFLECGKKTEVPRVNPHMQGEYGNSMLKDLRLGFELRTFLLEDNSATNRAVLNPSSANKENLGQLLTYQDIAIPLNWQVGQRESEQRAASIPTIRYTTQNTASLQIV